MRQQRELTTMVELLEESTGEAAYDGAIAALRWVMNDTDEVKLFFALSTRRQVPRDTPT